MYHGSSNAATPAKTPNSVQKLRRASLSYSKSSKPKSSTQRGNRTQLFSPSPLRSEASDLTEASFQSLQSLDDSPVPMWDQTESGSKQWKRNPFDRSTEPGKGKRVSPYRKEEQVTLGEFLNKSDGHNHKGRRNKSPACGHNPKDDHTMYMTPSNNRRRSGGKSRSGHSEGSSQRARFKQRQQTTGSPPVFSLNMEEFPSMGKSSSAPARSAPRRITPTAVTPSDAHRQMTVQTFDTPSYDSPAFNPPVQPPPGFTPISSPTSSARLTFSSTTTSPRNQPLASGSSSTRGLDKERELLRIERLKQGDYVPSVASPREIVPSTPPKQPLIPSKTPTKSPARCGLFTVAESALPCRDSVTYTEKLNLLAGLYSACLQGKY